jgi:hypothetical protein
MDSKPRIFLDIEGHSIEFNLANPLKKVNPIIIMDFYFKARKSNIKPIKLFD